MNKITINKAFEKYFDQIIWKIEVDSTQGQIAVETRDPESTLPRFHLLGFDGHSLGEPFCPKEKEWTMDSVQRDMLILKRLGDSTPIKEGVKIVGIGKETGSMEDRWTSYEYTLVDVYDGYVAMRHRNVSQGGLVFLCLDTGQISRQIHEECQAPPVCHVSFPISFPSCPPFLEGQHIEGQLWLNGIDPHYVWSYHIKKDDGYDLALGVSDRHQLLSAQVILKGMPKMVPQPYFQVGRQLFFLSYNKQEIVSYLV